MAAPVNFSRWFAVAVRSRPTRANSPLVKFLDRWVTAYLTVPGSSIKRGFAHTGLTSPLPVNHAFGLGEKDFPIELWKLVAGNLLAGTTVSFDLLKCHSAHDPVEVLTQIVRRFVTSSNGKRSD